MAEKSGKSVTAEKAAARPATKSAKPKVRTQSTAKAPAKPKKKKTSFKLRAPEAAQVFVAGCFNDWNPTASPLMREEEGTWTCTLMLEPGEHEYRFIVDGVWWDDPMALTRRPNEFGCENCIVIV